MKPKLKRKKKREEYPDRVCAASRCKRKAFMVDATYKVWPNDRVPLCERHWEQRCGVEGGDEG
jgi:hypothetical protein